MGSIARVNESTVRFESIQGSRNGTVVFFVSLDIFVLRDIDRSVKGTVVAGIDSSSRIHWWISSLKIAFSLVDYLVCIKSHGHNCRNKESLKASGELTWIHLRRVGGDRLKCEKGCL